MLKPEIYIRGERLDLFKDENIEIVSSVQNIEDISRVFDSFSQSFTVPATQNNNKIFKHWYNFTLDNGFDARVRHPANIDIHGTPFKKGTLRMESCEIKDRIPVHYKLTFFGQLIDLKKVIGEDYLSALPLDDYDIDYTTANVITGLTTGFSSQDYIFPLISTQRQWFYNSNSGVTTYEEKLANIAWNGSVADHGLQWTSLRPALKVMRIVEAIETEYGLTFSRDFLGTTPFDNLYLWLANQDSTESLKSKYRVVDYDNVSVFQPAIGSYDNATGAYSPTASGSSKIREIDVRLESTDGVLCTLQIMNNDNVLEELSGTGDISIDYDLFNGVEEGSSIYCRIVTSTAKTVDDFNIRIKELSEDTVLFNEKANFSISGSTARINEFLPKIKVMDFLKNLINMYNLVVVPNSDTDFYINTLDDWYAEGEIYDISQYVDTNKNTVTRSKIYREIVFKFKEPQTILAEQFAKTNPTPYGDLGTKLKNADGEPLDGDKFEISLESEQMVYEKLFDLNDDSNTNIVYGLSLDNGLDEVTPEPHFFYAILRDISANPIGIVDDTGTKNQLNTNVFMPSHADSNTGNYSTCWGGEINEHTGGIITNSLFKLYYEDYIKDSFSIKRRKHDIMTKLPLWLMNKLKLNDRLIINGDRYIINEMSTNITTQIINFTLLNDIFGLESDITVEEEVNPNPTPRPLEPVTGNSFSISATGASTSAGGCAQIPNTVKYWNGSESYPTLGNFIYNNIGLTSSFDGGNDYYKIANDLAIRINSSGIVTDVFDCNAGVSL